MASCLGSEMRLCVGLCTFNYWSFVGDSVLLKVLGGKLAQRSDSGTELRVAMVKESIGFNAQPYG